MILKRKVPREAFADALELAAEHARRYVLTGMTAMLDSKSGVYRIAIEGEGELLLEQGEPDDEPAQKEQAG